MKTTMLAALASSATAFMVSPPSVHAMGSLRGGSAKMEQIGDSGVAFENVAREWRCK